ncbi:M61 family metallopeptidase [Gallaecimonas mangrovi]|uniref:M61 family metallopeptidase n=1 Tax=Gallaecimonas mangrovi TaxID=2291597 RepID=UPI000E1FC30F|nr:hypothetical protein [Gallaecimonas mangrovi]
MKNVLQPGVKALALLLGLSFWLPAVAAAPSKLDLQLTPITEHGAVVKMHVKLTLAHPDVKAGAPLLNMPTELVSTPTAAYNAKQLHAVDAKGTLPLTAKDLPADDSGRYRNYLARRASVGDVTVTYSAAPRKVDASTRNGPLFDLRQQQGGIMGAGVYFLALPVGSQPYQLKVHWDLSQMPKGARGVWSRGEGTQQKIAPAEYLRFSFYAAGTLKSVPKDGSGDFVVYWLNKPPFDMPKLAEQSSRFYHYMAHFFGDKRSYRVFARANPYPAGGGTALAGSFMFGYGPNGQTIASGSQLLLAHEMTHTWPTFNKEGEPHAETAWYTEGTAEFYSLLGALRSGALTQAQYLAQINDRAQAYYGNPFVHLTNAQAGKLFWRDARAQTVPYGRGFMYLMRLNEQLKAKTAGKVSVDSLVLDIWHRQQRGETVGIADWKAMLKQYLGEAAINDFNNMVAGKLIAPTTTAFDCLKAVEGSERPFDLGYDVMRLAQINQLRPDSNAAKAGLKDGDEVLSYTPLAKLKADPKQLMHIVVKRSGKTLHFTYLPRSPEVKAWQWHTIAGAKCHFG